MIIAKPAQLARASFARAHDNKEAYKLLSNKCNKTINSLIMLKTQPRRLRQRLDRKCYIQFYDY